MNALEVKTPNYVLLEGKDRLSPKLLPLDSGQNLMAVYGFSDKQPYDAFCQASELALAPYPLVKGYLQSQLEEAGDSVSIIVVDAAGPSDPVLFGATMQAVLEAHEARSTDVAISYQLTKDEASSAYRVEECASSVKQ